MPRISDDYKQDRLERVANYLIQNADGLTVKEISQALNIEERTLRNYLYELDMQGRAWRDKRMWYPPPFEGTYLRRFSLSAEHAATMYLATRLLVKLTDKRNEIAETVLSKLAHVLAGDAGVDRAIVQIAEELAQRPGDDAYSNIFKAIARGYVYRRWVSITYQPRKKRPFQTMFAPYLLEPVPVGFTTYAIGHSSIVDNIRTYKLERIQEAVLTRDEFTVPDDFDGIQHLRHAWSIIPGEEVIEVVLRFHSRVADRVLETRWHPSEQTQPDPERPGYLLWSAHIADLTDFLPWVRGWGADVEALAPQELRDRLQGESRRTAELYGWRMRGGDSNDENDRAQAYRDFFSD